MGIFYLDELIIQPADDLETELRLVMDAASSSLTADGEVHTFGGGRQVAHFGPGIAETPVYTCEQVTRADIEQLRAWAIANELLLFRDPRGGKTFGVLFGLPYVWTAPNQEIANVTLTVTAVTVDEGA